MKCIGLTATVFSLALFAGACDGGGGDGGGLGASPARAQEPAAGGGANAAAKSTVSVEVVSPEVRRVVFANPPVNMIVPETIASLNAIVKDLSKDENLKVVIFASGVPGYFFNHFDMSEFANFVSQVGTDGKPLWVELIGNIERAPFISIGSIRGRTQGGGDELTLSLDLRYASESKAVFNQPEVGIGLFPGGGGPDHLTRLAGRDRTLEVFLSSDDYSAEQAERYGWVTRSLPDEQLEDFVTALAARLATFDKNALIATKQHINAIALPQEPELLNSYSEFVKSLSSPGLQARTPIFQKIFQQFGLEEVENKLGYYVAEGNRQVQQGTK